MAELKANLVLPSSMSSDEKKKIEEMALTVFSRDGLESLNDPRYAVFPGFCDVHVHFREPGFSYKETIKTGSLAAAAGGYTDVCAMPNLKPVADSLEHIKEEQDIIDMDAVIGVHPYGAITIGELGKELVNMEEMAPHIIAFSDDGKGVQDPCIMREAMERAKALNKIIVAHCEDETLLDGGYIHKGSYAEAHGHKGISSESEWKQVERDVKLAEETGVSYHVCHVSTKESVELIRDARRSGVDVTGETAPHYLILTDEDLQEDGRFKMNPPIRSSRDREALIQGVSAGTLGMLITDHAPHSREEKSKGLSGSAFGIVGLETAFPLLYTRLVKKDIIPLDRILDGLTVSPRRRFGLPLDEGFTVYDLEEEYEIRPEEFLTKGRATPFAGWKVNGRCLLTVLNGEIRYMAKDIR